MNDGSIICVLKYAYKRTPISVYVYDYIIVLSYANVYAFNNDSSMLTHHLFDLSPMHLLAPVMLIHISLTHSPTSLQ